MRSLYRRAAAPAAEQSSTNTLATITLSQPIPLTLLSLTLLRREVRIATIRCIGTSIELLITAALQRRAQIHKRILLDREWAVLDPTVEDWGGGDAAEGAGEALRVGLADTQDAGAAECGEGQEDGGGEVHFEDVVGWKECKGRLALKKRMTQVKWKKCVLMRLLAI